MPMGWNNIDSQLFSLTLGQMHWGRGGLPWFCNNDFTNQMFPNCNWGNVGDWWQCNAAAPGVSGGGGSNKTDDVDESDMTPEEKLAAKEEKAKKKAEIQKLVDNYNKMYTSLEEYGKTLTDKSTPTKTEFEETLNEYKNKATKSMKKETLEEKIADIKVMYDKYKDKIQEAKTNKIKSSVTSNNTKYTTLANSVKTAITSGNDELFGGILAKGDDGTFEWGTVKIDGEEQDIDVMEFLSSWNNANVGTSAKPNPNAFIIKAIASKYATASGENKGKYETLSNRLHDKLEDEGNSLLAKLNDEITHKEALQEAINKFAKFDTIGKRFPSGTNGENYNNAFENLYRAIRLAEAEKADKELKEEFDFLGDENPYKDGTLLRTAEDDLKTECRTNATEVTDPVEPEKTAEELAKEKGCRNADCPGIYYNESEKKHYYYDSSSKNLKEMPGVGYVSKAGKCYKTAAKGDTTILGTVKDGVYTPSSTSPVNGSAQTEFTDDEIIAFFNATQRDTTSEHYDAWCKYGRKLADLLIGNTNSEEANKAADIIFNGMNVKNIFTVLAGYEDNDAWGDNIIEQLLNEDSFKGNYNNSKNESISVDEKKCIIQILTLAVQNLEVQKRTNNITEEIDNDIEILKAFIDNLKKGKTYATVNGRSYTYTVIDTILHRYSDMVDDKIEYDDDVD